MPKYQVDINEGPFKGRKFQFEGDAPPTDVDVQQHLSAMETSQGVKAQIAPAGPSPVRLPIAGGIEYTPTSEDIQRGRGIGSVAMPLVGGAIGTGLGGLAGGIAGAMAGTVSSQALGLEEPSAAGVLLSGVGQGAPAVLGKVLGSKTAATVAGWLPGVSRLKLDKAARTIVDDVDKLVQVGDSKKLWEGFKKVGGIAIKDTPATKGAIGEITEEMKRLSPGLPGAPELQRMVNGLVKKFNSGKPLDLLDLDANIKALGSLVGKFEREGGIQLGAAKKFLSSMHQDLENAALTMTVGSGQAQAAAMLRKAASNATKKAMSKEELLGTIQGSIKSVDESIGDLITVRPKMVLDRLRSLMMPASKSYDPNFVKSLSNELPQVISIFNKLNALTQGGGKPGSLVIQSKFAAAGGMVGAAIADWPGAGVGTIVGTQIPNYIENIILSPAGRAILDRGLDSVISSGNKAALANLFQLAFQAARRSVSAPEPEEETQTP